MVSLVQKGKYCVTNVVDPKKKGYYVMKYVSDAFKLQEDITTNRQDSKVGELTVRDEYLSCMKSKKKQYWKNPK